MPDFVIHNSDNTLEPPGTIAILGGGPLAVETALYARYLGFSVRLYSTDSLVSQLEKQPETAAPTLLATPLGLASLAAQRGLGGTMVELDCPNYEAWIDQYFRPLVEVDLLKGATCFQVQVKRIELAQVEDATDDTSEDATEDSSEDSSEDEVPPDFVIEWTDGHEDAGSEQMRTERFEAVIDMRFTALAGSATANPSTWFPAEVAWLGPGDDAPTNAPDYYLVLAELPEGTLTDSDMLAGFQRIQQLFALLCDRPKLDVYGSLGGFAAP